MIKILYWKRCARPASRSTRAKSLTGLDRKAVDKAMAELKKEGAIVSPVRCKWTPA